MNPADARSRLLTDGELAWVYGPRRHELATVRIDDAHADGDVVLRDIVGARRRRSYASSSRISIRAERRPDWRSPEDPSLVSRTQADGGSISRRSPSTRETKPATADTAVVNPLFQSVNFIQEIGTERRAALSALRQLAERRDRSTTRRGARGRRSGGAAWRAEWARPRARLLALLRPGDHLLASSWIYGGAHALLTKEFAALGIDVTLVDPIETRVWRKQLRKETRAIFLETPVNPTCRVIDLRPVSYITKEVGIALVVDSTFASPINLRPLEHGADVVIHSATKYLNGHHDVLGGIVCGTASYIEEVRQKMMLWGQAPDPFAAWLLERGLQDARRPHAAAQRERDARRRVVRDAEGDSARCTIPGCPTIPITTSRKRRWTASAG